MILEARARRCARWEILAVGTGEKALGVAGVTENVNVGTPGDVGAAGAVGAGACALWRLTRMCCITSRAFGQL